MAGAPLSAAAAEAPAGGAQRTAAFSIVAAAGLVALKLVTGILTGSLALIAEAAHSGTDLVAAILTFYAVRVAGRPADREHPYGHNKAEHLAALGEGAFLVVVSGLVAFESARRLADGGGGEVDAAWWAFAVLGVVLVVDVARATISWRASRRYGSAALAASALHFASDFAGTIAVLIGLVLVRAGYPAADAVAALFVAGLVVLAAVRLMRRNVDVLMDRAPGDAAEAARAAIAAVEPRAEVRRVRVREAGGRAFVDAVVAVAPDAAVAQGHAVADNVERALHDALPGSDVTIHIEPRDSTDLRERATGAALSVRRVREVHNVRSVVLDGRTELSLHAKLPADLPLEAAHEIADEIEATVRAAVPEIDRVHVHLEPLAAALTAEPATPTEDDALRRQLERVSAQVTGRPPRSVHLHREPRGLVAFVTIELPGTEPLADAHDAAARVEALAEAASPGLAEVVVHTEPLPRGLG
jgi:cation diffusion facilitator family transporter